MRLEEGNPHFLKHCRVNMLIGDHWCYSLWVVLLQLILCNSQDQHQTLERVQDRRGYVGVRECHSPDSMSTHRHTPGDRAASESLSHWSLMTHWLSMLCGLHRGVLTACKVRTAGGYRKSWMSISLSLCLSHTQFWIVLFFLTADCDTDT